MVFKASVTEQLVRGLKPKKLPHKVGGKIKMYEFPAAVSASTGLVLRRIRDAAGQAAQDGKGAADLDEGIFEGLTDEQISGIYEEIMGDTEEQLAKDGVPDPVVSHMRDTLIVWHLFGEEAAEIQWEDFDGAPKAPADRKPKKTGSSKSTARRTSAKATTTRGRASGTRTARTR